MSLLSFARLLWHRSTIAGVVIVAACPSVARAQLTVMISGGFEAAYRQLLPDFERATGMRVLSLSGASQGTGPQTIAAQLARGAEVDVVILSREGLRELAAAGRLVPGTDVDLATTPLGMSVRAGDSTPDISTVDAFTRALLNARTIAIPGSTSGIYLTSTLFPRLGLTDRLAVTLTSRTTQTLSLVATGGAKLALAPVSELLHGQGTVYVGALPPEIQFVQTFSGAVVARSQRTEAAKRLIAFLASDAAAGAIRISGMEPSHRP